MRHRTKRQIATKNAYTRLLLSGFSDNIDYDYASIDTGKQENGGYWFELALYSDSVAMLDNKFPYDTDDIYSLEENQRVLERWLSENVTNGLVEVESVSHDGSRGGSEVHIIEGWYIPDEQPSTRRYAKAHGRRFSSRRRSMKNIGKLAYERAKLRSGRI